MKSVGQRGRLRLSGAAAGAVGLLLAGLGTMPAAAQDMDVTLDVTVDEQVSGAAGDVVEVTGTAVNTGTEDMVGGTVDFEVPEGAEILGVVGQELVDGTERPAEGCALASAQHLVCGTESTLSPGGSNEATFEVQIADDAAAGELGAAVTSVAGANGGEASAETVITVAEEGVALDVDADEQVEGEPGDVVEIATTVEHTGTEDLVGGTVDFEVPEGAEILGVVGQELVDGTERPAEGCALASAQHLVCGTESTLSPGGSNEATFEVQIADDAAAGELGAAVTSVAGANGGEASAETVITVAGTDEPTEEPTAEPTEDPAEDPTDEPTEDPGEDEAGSETGDDDLPDTGASTSALLAAAGLLLVGGAAVALRARRS